jgi:hypothetical protein
MEDGMAFGFGMGGYDGGPIGDGPHPGTLSRRNDSRPTANAERDIFPHNSPKMPVSEYVKEAAARAWLLPVYNWFNAGQPVYESQILPADPWRPDPKKMPSGYSKGATGSTSYFAQCWKLDGEGKGKGLLEKLSRPIPPEGFNLYLVVSGVTWRYTKENRCATNLIARIEGIIKYDSHELFMMKRAGKLLADVEAWLKGS